MNAGGRDVPCVSFILEDMIVECGLFGFQERNESESQKKKEKKETFHFKTIEDS